MALKMMLCPVIPEMVVEQEQMASVLYAAIKEISKLPLAKWRTEYAELQQAYQQDYGEYKPIPDNLVKLLQMKSTMDTVRRRQEQTHEKRRDMEW